MAVFKATENKKKTTTGSFQATGQRSYNTSTAYGWEKESEHAARKISRLNEKVNSGGYLSADDLDSYRKAVNSYIDSTNRLRTLGASLGQKYDDDWENQIRQMHSGLKDLKDYYGQWDSEDAFVQAQKYAAIPQSEDYDQYRGYKSTQLESGWERYWSEYGLGYGDLGYEYINNADGLIRGQVDDAAMENHSVSKYASYGQMTDDEINVYNYLYAKEGKAAADEYLSYLESAVNYRQGTKIAENIQGRPGLQMLFAIQAGGNQFQTGLKNLVNFKDSSIAPSATQIAAGMVREDLADKGPQILGSSVGQIGYDLFNTAGNMLPSVLVGAVNPVAGAAMMGAPASGNAYQEMLNLGYDKGQARLYSALVGASEAVLQYALGGISKLGGKVTGNAVSKLVGQVDNALGRVAIELGGSMLSEGVEEAVQSVLEPVFQAIATGEDFAGADIEEVLYSGLLGALSAGVMEGPGAVVNTVNTAVSDAKAKDVYGTGMELVGEALEIDPNNAYARKMQGKLDSGKELSGGQINRLVQQNEEALTTQDTAAIQQATRQRLEQLGESGDVEAVSAAIAKQATGLKLTRAERQVVINSKYGLRVANELGAENIKSGGYSSDWAKGIQTQRVHPEVYTGEQAAAQTAKTERTETATAEKTAAQTDAQAATVQESRTVEAAPRKVTAIHNGKVTVQAADGKQYEAGQIAYATEEDAQLWQTVGSYQNITPKAANAIIQARSLGKQSIADYLMGAAGVYRSGYYGAAVKAEYAQKLTPGQRELIYDAGKQAAGEDVARREAEIRSKGKKNSDPSKGAVHYDGDRSKLNETQKASLDTMEMLAKALGVQIHVFESGTDAKGNHIGSNGWYDRSDGSIHIDLFAGGDGKGTMLFTLAHELTHFVYQWSPAKFKVLANFLMEQYGQQGTTVDELIENQQKIAREDGRQIDEETAFEEAVASSMESMLTSGNVAQMMADLRRQDQTLWQKIKDWFRDIVGKIKAVVEAYKDAKPDSAEGKMVAAMRDVTGILESLYANAVVDASENFAGAQKNTAGDGGVRHQARRLSNEDLDAYLKAGSRNNKNKIDAINSGKKIILTSAQEIVEFIRNAITKKAGSTTVAYGKVNDRLAKDVLRESNGKIQIRDNYLELIPDNLQHAYEEHSIAKEEGDIDLTQEDFERIPEYLDTYTEVLYAIRYSSGNVRICVSKKLDNGRILIIETVSKSRGAIQFKNAIGVSEEKYESKYLSTYKKRAETNTRGSQSSNNSLRDSFNSNVSIRNDGENVNKRFSVRQRDQDYLTAVEHGDMDTAQKMVDQAAKEAGYNSPILYHGTRSFGFTEFDLSKMDDKRSIFLTDNERIAATYSGVMGKRNVSGEAMKPLDDLSTAELVEELNSDRFGTEADADDKYRYSYLSLKDINQFIGKVNSEIDALQGEVAQLIRQYADRMATDFDSKDHRTHEQLVKLERSIHSYAYRDISTQLYMLLHYTDAFNGTESEASRIAQLEQDVRLFNKLEHRDNSDGAIVESWLNGYSLNVLDKQQARDKLEVKRKTGNYGMYAKLDNALVIDANGAVWNDIRHWYHALGITMRSTQVERRGDSFALIDKASGEEIVEGRFAVNPATEGMSAEQLREYMVDKAQATLSITTENLNNTRDIAAFAQKRGYDGVIFRNLRDNGGHNAFVGTEEQADIYVLFDPKQAKSADPVTYDNDGNVIPLSERFNAKDNDIRYSTREKALEHFGRTYSWKETGYLLTDGSKLDFSGRHEGASGGYRTVDHRDILDIYPEDTDLDGNGAMVDFMKQGNIRIMPEGDGINLSVQPTKAQERALDDFISRARGEVTLDIDNERGDTVVSVEYPRFTRASKVIQDIRNYFESGAEPEISQVAQFRYSAREKRNADVEAVLRKENEQLKADVEKLKQMLKLQRTVTGGTKFTKTSVEAAARMLKKQNEASGSTEELAAMLNRFYEYIATEKELTWEGVLEQAREAADWLEQNRKHKRSEYAQDILDQIHGNRIYLDESQKAEAAYRFGSYNDFRKSLMGSITVVNEGGISLDSFWHEMAGLYPAVFDEDTVATDMPSALADIIDRLRNSDTSAMEYAYNSELYRQDLLRQVYDSYWRVSTLYTFADTKQAQIRRLKGEHYARMNELRTDTREQLEQLKQQHRQELEQVRQEYREKAEKQRREISQRYQESRKKATESRHRTEMRHKIQRVVKELNQYLLSGTKDKHVPIGLQKAVAEALDAVNMDTVGAQERITKLQQELGRAKTEDQRKEIRQRIENVRSMGERMDEKLKRMKDAYDEFLESDDPLIANAHDDAISGHMMTLIVKVGDTPLRDMNMEQLQAVYDVYQIVLTTVRNANKAFKAARNATISELGQNVMREIYDAGGKKQHRAQVMDMVNRFGWNNLKPVYAFSAMGSETFSEIFDNVRAGEDVWARDVEDAREFYLQKVEKYHYNDWDFEKRHQFTSTSGMDFELGLEQIMSLYAYSKREQAADHLRRGGIVIDETTEVTVKTKLGIPVKFNPTEATAYNISDETLAQMVDKLTKEQRAFVDEMQEYLSTTMGEKGNEVSLQMYGVKLFREKFYFPLKSATQFMAKAKEQQQGEVRIKNAGFSKETVRNANNPIVLTPFMDVWGDHVNEMSMYHAFVLPMEDLYRVYSYRTATSDTAATKSVEMFIQNAYGKGATGYIDQLLKDLNGGARTDNTTGIMNKAMGLYKKGAVFASLSVVVQQPSAIARAAALVDLHNFIGPKIGPKDHKTMWAEIKKYAPVAIIKEMGYFDTNMGKSTQDYITGREYTSWDEKLKALVTDSNYRDEALSKLPALADEIAWCGIWQAVKREVRDSNPGMDNRSEEFLQKVGKRFTEVIVKTQVYDSVLARSGLMRSKDTGMKMATAFMAEPTTSINMITDALLQGKRGNRRYCRKAIGAVVASQILNSILVSFVYAMRDDDDDETYWEKYLQSLGGSLEDGLNPATYIPFIRDILSIVQGYDVERSDMAIISDVMAAWNKLDSDKVSTYRKVEDFVGSISKFFGLPVKNIMRDIRGIWHTIFGEDPGEEED